MQESICVLPRFFQLFQYQCRMYVVEKSRTKFPDIKIFKEMILFAAVKKTNSGYSWKMTNFRKNET